MAEKLKQPNFELCAGNLCLDFINTLDDRPSNPKELLGDYCALANFGEQTGILTPAQKDQLFRRAAQEPDEAEKSLRRARDLREALYAIFSGVMNKRPAPNRAREVLNENLHDAALHSRLVPFEGRFEWRFDDPASSFRATLWPIARAAADLLTSDQLPFVRACASTSCRWFFLDTSKNHRRRWCDMTKCGNRAKVKEFYARNRIHHGDAKAGSKC